MEARALRQMLAARPKRGVGGDRVSISHRLLEFSDQEVAVLYEAIRDLTSSKDRGEDLKVLYLELLDEMVGRAEDREAAIKR